MSVNILPRSQWKAKPALERLPLKENPPSFVIVHHSETKLSTTREESEKTILSMQTHHMNVRGYKDIGYNFVIGGDGNIYEGRGWGIHGAHCPNYNSKSIGICVLGSFMTMTPLPIQVENLKKLIAYGVSQGKIATNYHLIGHRQGKATLCPGDHLFNEIKKMSRFDSSVKL